MQPSERHQNTGHKYFIKKDYKSALVFYKLALMADEDDRNPKKASLHNSIAQSLFNEKKYRAAEEHAANAVALDVDSEKGYFRAAKAAAASGELDKAAGYLKIALQRPKLANSPSLLKFKTALLSQMECGESSFVYDEDQADEDIVTQHDIYRKITANKEQLPAEMGFVEPVQTAATNASGKGTFTQLLKTAAEEQAAGNNLSMGQLKLRRKKMDYDQAIHEAAELLLRKRQFVTAALKYQEALDILTEFPAESMGLASITDTLLKYCIVDCWCQPIYVTLEQMTRSIEHLSKIRKAQPAERFPAVFYGYAQVYSKLNRFERAKELALAGLDVLKKEPLIRVHCWPGSRVEIPETTRDGLEQALRAAIADCSVYRPPDATCRNVEADCFRLSKQIIPSRLIYYNDVDFNGFMEIHCESKCVITYHIGCWRDFKERQSELRGNKLSDKDILGLPCPTEDCSTPSETVSTITYIAQLYDNRRPKFTVEREVPKDKALKKKIDNTKASSPTPKSALATRPKNAHVMKKGGKGVPSNSATPYESDETRALSAAVDNFIALRKQNFKYRQSQIWDLTKPFYGRSDLPADDFFLTPRKADASRDFVLSYFKAMLEQSSPMLVTDVEDVWTDSKIAEFDQLEKGAEFPGIVNYLTQSYQFAVIGDQVCLAANLEPAHAQCRLDATECVQFLVDEETKKFDTASTSTSSVPDAERMERVLPRKRPRSRHDSARSVLSAFSDDGGGAKCLDLLREAGKKGKKKKGKSAASAAEFSEFSDGEAFGSVTKETKAVAPLVNSTPIPETEQSVMKLDLAFVKLNKDCEQSSGSGRSREVETPVDDKKRFELDGNLPKNHGKKKDAGFAPPKAVKPLKYKYVDNSVGLPAPGELVKPLNKRSRSNVSEAPIETKADEAKSTSKKVDDSESVYTKVSSASGDCVVKTPTGDEKQSGLDVESSPNNVEEACIAEPSFTETVSLSLADVSLVPPGPKDCAKASYDKAGWPGSKVLAETKEKSSAKPRVIVRPVTDEEMDRLLARKKQMLMAEGRVNVCDKTFSSDPLRVEGSGLQNGIERVTEIRAEVSESNAKSVAAHSFKNSAVAEERAAVAMEVEQKAAAVEVARKAEVSDKSTGTEANDFVFNGQNAGKPQVCDGETQTDLRASSIVANEVKIVNLKKEFDLMFQRVKNSDEITSVLLDNRKELERRNCELEIANTNKDEEIGRLEKIGAASKLESSEYLLLLNTNRELERSNNDLKQQLSQLDDLAARLKTAQNEAQTSSRQLEEAVKRLETSKSSQISVQQALNKANSDLVVVQQAVEVLKRECLRFKTSGETLAASNAKAHDVVRDLTAEKAGLVAEIEARDARLKENASLVEALRGEIEATKADRDRLGRMLQDEVEYGDVDEYKLRMERAESANSKLVARLRTADQRVEAMTERLNCRDLGEARPVDVDLAELFNGYVLMRRDLSQIKANRCEAEFNRVLKLLDEAQEDRQVAEEKKQTLWEMRANLGEIYEQILKNNGRSTAVYNEFLNNPRKVGRLQDMPPFCTAQISDEVYAALFDIEENCRQEAAPSALPKPEGPSGDDRRKESHLLALRNAPNRFMSQPPPPAHQFAPQPPYRGYPVPYTHPVRNDFHPTGNYMAAPRGNGINLSQGAPVFARQGQTMGPNLVHLLNRGNAAGPPLPGATGARPKRSNSQSSINSVDSDSSQRNAWMEGGGKAATTSKPSAGVGRSLVDISVKSCSYESLINILIARFPGHSPHDLNECLGEIRSSNNGSLRGYTPPVIIKKVAEMLLSKTQKKGWAPVAGADDGGATKWRNPLDESECAICMEVMLERGTTSLPCDHIFHAKCIKKWLVINSVCPTCKRHTKMDDEYPPLK